jgi:hypothetical protein
MKLREIMNDGNNETVEKLLWLVDGSTYAADIEAIEQHLLKQGTDPTLENVKRHLVNHLMLPLELLKEPERAIILRAKSAD